MPDYRAAIARIVYGLVNHRRKAEMSEGEMESLSSEQTSTVRKSRGFFWKNPG
jgi:hypothetical protein